MSSSSYQKKDYEHALIQAFNKMDQLLQTKSGQQELMEIVKEQRESQNAPQENNENNLKVGCTATVCLIT